MPDIFDKLAAEAKVKSGRKDPLAYDAGPLAGQKVPGLLKRGNVDVNHRPIVKNDDGTSSTIFSVTVPIGKDGKSRKWDDPGITGYALVPSLANGRFLTPDGKKPDENNKEAMQKLEDAATDHYDKTREHLGIFKSDKDADTYAGQTHAWLPDNTSRQVYAGSYDEKGDSPKTDGQQPSSGDIFDQLAAEQKQTQPQHIDTHGVTLSAAPPQSAYQRFKNMLANSAIGHSVEQTMPRVSDALDLHPTTVYGPEYERQGEQLISPEELVPGNPTSTVAQLGKGALRGVGEMTSAPAMATGAAIAATGGLAGAAAPIAGGVIRAGSAGAGAAQTFKQLYDAYKLKQQGAPTGDAVEAAGAAIPGIAATIPAASELLKLGGKGAQKSAEGIIAHGVIGARDADVKRGADPGKGYFQSGRSPSLSMAGIADRAKAGMDVTSAALQKAYGNADASGKLIPLQAVRDALQSTIGDAWQSMTNAGGTGDTGSLGKFAATFEPELQAAEKRGGFKPSELWEIRKNIDKNTNWKDITKLDLSAIRQRTSGAIGGLLKEAVPETVDLNSAYVNQLKLQGRAEQRAATGQHSLSSLATKGALGAGGALLGAGHGAPEAAVGTLGALALDSVPVKTTGAAALHLAGEVAEGAGNIADKVPDAGAEGLAGAAAAPKKDDEDFKVTQTGPNTFAGPTVELAPAAGGGSALSGSAPPVPVDPQLKEEPANSQPGEVNDGDNGQTNEDVDQRAPQQQAELYTPETHQFSPAQWAAANPDGNQDEALAEAQRQGYEVAS